MKHIRKLDTTKALLKNHNASDFRFLDPTNKSSDTAVARCRMNYYAMLSRVLFSEDNIDSDFWRFVKPWELTLDQVALAFEGSSDRGEEDIRVSVVVTLTIHLHCTLTRWIMSILITRTYPILLP